MNSETTAIVWACLVVAFLVTMFFAARGGKEKPADSAAKSPAEKSPPPGAAKPEASGTEKQP